MKTLKLIAAMSALCTGLQSQPYTGLDTYVHLSTGSNLILSDGAQTSFNSQGFILSGYRTGTASGANLFIDKTDNMGGFTTPFDFSNEYKFGADMVKPCGGNLVSATN